MLRPLGCCYADRFAYRVAKLLAAVGDPYLRGCFRLRIDQESEPRTHCDGIERGLAVRSDAFISLPPPVPNGSSCRRVPVPNPHTRVYIYAAREQPSHGRSAHRWRWKSELMATLCSAARWSPLGGP